MEAPMDALEVEIIVLAVVARNLLEADRIDLDLGVVSYVRDLNGKGGPRYLPGAEVGPGRPVRGKAARRIVLAHLPLCDRVRPVVDVVAGVAGAVITSHLGPGRGKVVGGAGGEAGKGVGGDAGPRTGGGLQVFVVVSACNRGPGAGCAKACTAVVDDLSGPYRGCRVPHDVIRPARIDEEGVDEEAFRIGVGRVLPVNQQGPVDALPLADYARPLGIEEVVVAAEADLAVARNVDAPACIHPDDVVRENGLGGSVAHDDPVPQGLVNGVVRDHVVVAR